MRTARQVQFEPVMKTMISLAFALSLVAGCTSKDQTDIADATVNGQSFHVFREGPMPAAGVSTDIVIKPMTGTKPDSVIVWVGTADTADSAKTTGDFDPNDGDFDSDLTCPNPMPEGSLIYFTITEGSTVTTSSVAIK